MKKTNPVLVVGLIVVALGLLTFSIFKTMGSSGGSASEMAALTPKPRDNSPTFTRGANEIVMQGRGQTPAQQPPTGGR